MPVAARDRLRLRTVAHGEAPDGKVRRLANGSTVNVSAVDAFGRLVLVTDLCFGPGRSFMAMQ